MSRNAYTLFEKNIFLEMGGTGEVHLEWGRTQDDHPKWGGCTQVPPKMGGGLMSCRAEKGTPLSLFLAPSLIMHFCHLKKWKFIKICSKFYLQMRLYMFMIDFKVIGQKTTKLKTVYVPINLVMAILSFHHHYHHDHHHHRFHHPGSSSIIWSCLPLKNRVCIS